MLVYVCSCRYVAIIEGTFCITLKRRTIDRTVKKFSDQYPLSLYLLSNCPSVFDYVCFFLERVIQLFYF